MSMGNVTSGNAPKLTLPPTAFTRPLASLPTPLPCFLAINRPGGQNLSLFFRREAKMADAEVLVIDGRGHLRGRLAAIVAKQVLLWILE
ncbi:hypothetical protein FKM82_013350 [Ascaphus truei]